MCIRDRASIDTLIASGEEDALAQGLSGEAYRLARLSDAYEAYLGGLVHKFGLARPGRHIGRLQGYPEHYGRCERNFKVLAGHA